MSVFDNQSFLDPAAEFRPLQIVHGLDVHLTDPEALSGEQGIDRFLSELKGMGIGGIVTNVGFKDYMDSPRQFEILRYGLKKANELGLLLWLYDEKGYPSGTAGGIVTRAHPDYAALGLACYRIELDGPCELRYDLPISCRRFVWAGAVTDTASAVRAGMWYLSTLVDASGTLSWKAPAGHWTVFYLAERFMYEGTHASGNVCEFKHYVNLLKTEAVAEFLRVTHERYHREIPPELWSKIRAIFTDEPSFMTTYVSPLPERFNGKIPVVDAPLFKDRPAALPWVEDLLERFKAIKGYDLRLYLYALFTSATDEACYVRQDYYDVITRLYVGAFYRQVLRWCQAHGIASSGHVLLEEGILNHVRWHGSLFAVIREMDLPGIDMLNSDPQNMLEGDAFMAAKQVASVAHLCGRKTIHSESSDWVQGNEGRFATLLERMGQGNLQYVLGVNQITAYWGWVEIGADAYHCYNDYMGRLASLLTGGCHVCDTVVLYPVRSIWARCPGSTANYSEIPAEDGQAPILSHLAGSYMDLVRHLLRHQVDLDIIDEEAIVAGRLQEGALCVADECYRTIVLPPLVALGLETAQMLVKFVAAGGLLISTGDLPVIAESADATVKLRQVLERLFGGTAFRIIPEALVPFLRSKTTPDFSLEADNDAILYTHRRLEGRDVYFIINNSPTPQVIHPKLRVAGPYTLYRPLDGSSTPAAANLTLELAGYGGVFVVK